MSTEPANPLEVRMARLEGSYEQIDKRLTHLEARMDTGFAEVRSEIRDLRNLIFVLFGALAGLITVFEFVR